MPYCNGPRFMFEANELLIVVRQEIAELFPPAFLSGFFCEFEQCIAARSSYLVVIEKFFPISRSQAGPGQFVPADLGGRPLQCRCHHVAALARTFPDRTQFGGEPTAPHGRAPWHRHPASLLLGTC